MPVLSTGYVVGISIFNLNLLTLNQTGFVALTLLLHKDSVSSILMISSKRHHLINPADVIGLRVVPLIAKGLMNLNAKFNATTGLT